MRFKYPVYIFALVVAGGDAVWSGPAAAGTFSPNEVIVSDPNSDFLTGITDPEFDGFGRFTWVDREGTVWVANVDRTTGAFDPPDGYGVAVDTGATTVAEIGNGPEWVLTSTGAAVVYGKHFGSTSVLMKATLQGESWIARPLRSTQGYSGVFGSMNRRDPSPTLSYLGLEPETGYRPLLARTLGDPATERMVPTTDQYKVSGMRWVPGQKRAVFSRPMPVNPAEPSRRQAFLYDYTDNSLEQLTFDPGSKQAVFMWAAPEYDNEYIFFALISERYLGIYRNLDEDGDGVKEWTLSHTIDPPGLDYIWSPEPFVFGGKSYIVMVTSPTDDQQSISIPTEIWLADIMPENTLYRRLSNDQERVRKDPEIYVTSNGPYVYILAGGDGSPDIHRLDTGLGPQRQ